MEVTKLGFFESDRFYLRKDSHKKIFTHFKSFYVHRVQYVGLNKKISKQYVDPSSYLQQKP